MDAVDNAMEWVRLGMAVFFLGLWLFFPPEEAPKKLRWMRVQVVESKPRWRLPSFLRHDLTWYAILIGLILGGLAEGFTCYGLVEAGWDRAQLAVLDAGTVASIQWGDKVVTDPAVIKALCDAIKSPRPMSSRHSSYPRLPMILTFKDGHVEPWRIGWTTNSLKICKTYSILPSETYDVGSVPALFAVLSNAHLPGPTLH